MKETSVSELVIDQKKNARVQINEQDSTNCEEKLSARRDLL